ncbi:MAG: OB-fold nucleic acid binding domain-containing protein, partial [Halobaculum sp.]
VANLTVGDETGRVRVTLWDEAADYAAELSPGPAVEIVDGYVRERDGDLELHVGDRGSVEPVDADVSYEPETTAIADVELGETADIAGGVVETGEKRTFDRDDGSEGQVRNVRLKDDSGEIRVALWGEKADEDIALADRVVCTDVEIQEGWQDDLEASAGWGSTVFVTDDADAGGDAGGDTGGLGSFADSGSDDSTTGDDSVGSGRGGSATGTSASGGLTGESAETADESMASSESGESSGSVEFTGTVVQSGSPAVLDDGTETKRVETDETLRLGEEVTVRGPERDGTIDAEDVF